MKNKEFLVIGVGSLGKNLVATLYNSDVELLVMDKDASKLEEIEGMATQIICADASKEEVLSQLEIEAFDGAVITIGDDFESVVKMIMHLNEMGMPFIMVKATNDFEGRIYKKLGADKIIFPEREVGIRLGREISTGNYFDAIDLSDKYSITDLKILKDWGGKSIMELNLRMEYGISVIGIRRSGELIINPSAKFVFEEDDELIVLGENNDIQVLREMK